MVAELSAVSALLAHAPALATSNDPLQIIRDPVGWVQSWLWAAVFGKEQTDTTTWVGGMFSGVFYFTGLDAPLACEQTQSTTGACAFFGIWRATAVASGIILTLALLLRMCMVLFDGRRQVRVAQWLFADVVIRGMVTLVAVQVSYFVLAFAMRGSIAIGAQLFELTTGTSGQEALSAQVNDLLKLHSAPLTQLAIIGLLMYLTVLIAASRVAMLFAIAVGPLVIPVYAYSRSSELLVWWTRILSQGVLVPLAAGPLLGVALVAIHAVQDTTSGLLSIPIGAITAIAALWFVGHSIQKLLGYMFHGHKSVVHGVSVFGGAVSQMPEVRALRGIRGLGR
jgi:hypothetical protein